MKNQSLIIGIYSGILLCFFLELMAIGDFLRSAELGSTMAYWFWLFFACGILVRITLIKYLISNQYRKSVYLGILEFISWIAVQSYLLSAIYINSKYDINIHFQIHYGYQIILFIFGIIILVERTQSRILNGLATLFLIFSITVGIEYFTEASFGEYLRFLDPIPIILMVILFRKELKKIPLDNPEVIDDPKMLE